MNMPKINKRIRQIINLKTDGNLTEFARITGVSQQRISRLFYPDRRTKGKYPKVPAELLIAIAKIYDDINLKWLLTGKENYKINKENNITKSIVAEQDINYGLDKDYLIKIQKDLITSLKTRIEELKKGQENS